MPDRVVGLQSRRRRVRVGPVLALGLVLGCAPAGDRTGGTAANVVEVVTTDFAFLMPDTLPAGPTTFRLVNQGREFHHIQLVRIEQGRTFADFAALPPGAPAPAWLVLAGGPNTPVPGGTSELTLDLLPGVYAVTCFIPSPDGVLHIAKGMVKALTVVASPEAGDVPEADVTMTLNDYSFQLSAPLESGDQVIRVVTEADQPHEVLFVRLEPGKTAADVAAWVEGGMQGPPPGAPIGGTTGLSRGEVNLVHVDLTPGRYGLLCFLPDARDGRPHVAHGMMTTFTVE